MAQDFGNGVSRTLSALQRQFQTVVWQASKPPLDSELNLMSQMEMNRMAEAVRSQMHSGFLLDPMRADADFVTETRWSNWFTFGRPPAGEDAPPMWANVNGWIIPVTGSGVGDGDPSNRINLFQPPATEARIDLVFLEVWQGQIAPNPSTANKPSASTIYKYGNTQFGGTNFADEMKDPTMGFETTERVQIQYRIRTYGSGTGLGDAVDLAQYPDGLNDPNVLAQGTMASPVAGYVWNNMGDALGDRGLWRAGNGDSNSRTELGTVDGYVYAIPICAVFRRNSGAFVARTNDGNANQNGGFDRNPVSGTITDPLQATRTFTPVTLTAALPASGVLSTGVVTVTGLANSGLDNVNINWSSVAMEIGGEIMVIQAVNASTGEIMIASTTDTVNPWTGATLTPTPGRGRFGTQAAPHVAGSALRFFNFRPDGRFSDGITASDILDLRRGITASEWSYEDILKHNLGRVLDGSLKSSYKQGSGTNTQGTEIIEVDSYIGKYASPLPHQTEQLDGFDSIREVFSDSAVVQNDVSLLLSVIGGVPTLSANSWDAGAAFTVTGHVPAGTGQSWENGTILEVGITRARETSDTDNAFMRFVAPQEYWLSRDEMIRPSAGAHGNQSPFLMRFVGGIAAGEVPYLWSQPEPPYGSAPQQHPGPMFPLNDGHFEHPYIVLGGLADSTGLPTDVAAEVMSLLPAAEINLGIVALDFDTAGLWYGTAVDDLSTAGITNLLLHGTRNLYDLLTNGGRDPSGASSELYMTMTDTTNPGNNGCFRVIGAGTAGYTWHSAANDHSVIVERVGAALVLMTAAAPVTVKFRTQYTNTDDTDIAIVLTDLAGTLGGTANPWSAAGTIATTYTGDMVLDTSLLYGPSRGATARVATALDRFAALSPASTVLREAPENIDPDSVEFRARTGVPQDEYYYPAQPIPTWNRLPSLGGHAPNAPAYGSGRYNFETLREAELFVDEGSKSVIFRPFQQLDMSWALNLTGTNQLPGNYDPAGGGGVVMGGSGLFQLQNILSLPPEYMPRFGRQDIPARATAGASGPYIGINHLFGDSETITDTVRNVIGGANTVAPASINTPLRISTALGIDYGQWSVGDASFQGRLYEDVNARSSDINKPLRGIQLPPYIGIARVYGVYEATDYDDNGGAWTDEGFTLKTTGSIGTNLLRTDADKQTMYIVKDGAADVLAGHDAHTYLIPEEAIDIQKIAGWTDASTFATYNYVVEVAIFAFAEGFINQNSYVLLRSDSALAASNLLSDGRMIIPAAMQSSTTGGTDGYSAYTRTVYQGDPYMTRNGPTMQTADYQNRYGMVSVANANAVNPPLQQYSTANDQIPEIPNARALEVLASVDFWTTLGTGKMGGPVWPGTPTDPGHLTASGTRLPESLSQNPFQPQARAFSAPQPTSAGYASMGVVMTDRTVMVDQIVVISRGTATASFGYAAWTGATVQADMLALAALINASDTASTEIGVWAAATGSACRIYARMPGKEGSETVVSLTPASGTPTVMAGLRLTLNAAYGNSGSPGSNQTVAALTGFTEVAANAKQTHSAPTPLRLTGMTERLPLGILVQDSDFIGEDPLRKGMAYEVISGGGDQSTQAVTTFSAEGQENTRLSGPGGTIGMADGAILEYTAYNATSAPDGVKQFRLYRGGGSAYVVSPKAAGGPVDFTSGGFSEGDDPMLKGAVLVGRAYLVRNGYEEAFTGNVTRSYGDEVQMVVLTNAVYGEGLDCDNGYVLDGIISPTDYGKGYAASDRYRLEGKPLVKSRAALPDPRIPLAPYPPEDPADDDPCA
jgi:hypothetical protein